jgi:8-oxo-dGTP diphosphatase
MSIDVGVLPAEPEGVVRRTAVRAVIRRGDELLMIHSSVGGDFKFPGGGLEPGESTGAASAWVARELRVLEFLAGPG